MLINGRNAFVGEKMRMNQKQTPGQRATATLANIMARPFSADTAAGTRKRIPLSKQALAIAAVLSAGSSSAAFGIELYVDTKTKQLYAEPGPRRVLMGTFERVQDKTAKAETRTAPATEIEIASIKDELKIKTSEIKALEEHIKAPESKPETAGKGMLPAGVTYGKKGFEFKTEDGKFSLAIQNRLQLRYAMPFDKDPRSISDLEHDDTSSFMVRRARTKLSGNLYWPFLKYYMQYDWSQPVLRDLNLTVDKFKWAQVRVGRGKVTYNDERVTSSGNQQFVNRSIVNDIFTVDRQQGVELKGNLFPSTWYDVSYYAGIYSGMGVGERNNDDDNMMWAGRLQWNALGGEMPFSQSDTEYHEKPALNFAMAAATNQSKCTAFETDSNSCRSLPGFTVGQAGQYRVNQMMQETRFKWKGLSIQEEMHWKDVVDTFKTRIDNDRETHLTGGYVQAGYFPHYILQVIPKELEFAGRYAFVDSYREIGKQQEASGVMTYFFDGHSNKLNFQVSHLTVGDPSTGASKADQRYWVQWDVSF